MSVDRVFGSCSVHGAYELPLGSIDHGDIERGCPGCATPEEETWGTCDNCCSEIDMEQYNRTGTDEYCDDCPELCCDPRSKAMGQCECDDE